MNLDDRAMLITYYDFTICHELMIRCLAYALRALRLAENHYDYFRGDDGAW